MMICLANMMMEWAKTALQSKKLSSEGEQNLNICSGKRNNHLTSHLCTSSYCTFEPFLRTCYRFSSRIWIHLFCSLFVVERARKGEVMAHACSRTGVSPAASSCSCLSHIMGWCHPLLSFPPQVSVRCCPTSRALLGWLNLGCSNEGVRLKCVWRGAVLERVAVKWR